MIMASQATYAYFNVAPSYQPFDHSIWLAFVEDPIHNLIYGTWAASPRPVSFYYISGTTGASVGRFRVDGGAAAPPSASMRGIHWAVLIANKGVGVGPGAAPAEVAAVAFICTNQADARPGPAALCHLNSVNHLAWLITYDPAPGLVGAARHNNVFASLLP